MALADSIEESVSCHKSDISIFVGEAQRSRAYSLSLWSTLVDKRGASSICPSLWSQHGSPSNGGNHMHSFDPQILISQDTGDLDMLTIRHRARQLARRDYAGDNPPPAIFRSHFLNTWNLALALRRRWRADHSLPDDT